MTEEDEGDNKKEFNWYYILLTMIPLLILYRKGKAKAYQVKQVLLALEKLEINHVPDK